MSSNALQLQLDMAGFMASHSLFDYVPIICEYRDEQAGDALLDDLVLKQLKGQSPKNGKWGLCVILSFPEAKTDAPNSPGLVENFSMMVQIVESKAHNRAPGTGTGIRADDMYENVKRMLHLHSPDGEHALIVIKGEQDLSLPSTLRGFIIQVESKAHALQPFEKVKAPTITFNAGVMTLACATAEAAIYYTTDGSFPGPTNTASAFLYSAPVDVSALPANTVIRAAAFLEPLRGSDTRAKKI